MFFAAARTKFATLNSNGLTTKVPVSPNSFEDTHVQICCFLFRNSIQGIGPTRGTCQGGSHMRADDKKFRGLGLHTPFQRHPNAGEVGRPFFS